MNGVRKRLSDMSFSMINVFKDPQLLRCYKGTVVKLENDSSYQRVFDKNK
ncbi:DUF1506 family protein, partial [Borreliella burgdorferi]